jgi:hypothetical protein
MELETKLNRLDRKAHEVYRGLYIAGMLLVPLFVALAQVQTFKYPALQAGLSYVALVDLLFVISMTSYWDYSLQPDLDRAQNELIAQLRAQFADFNDQIDQQTSQQSMERLPNLDLKIGIQEQRTRFVDRASWVSAAAIPAAYLTMAMTFDVHSLAALPNWVVLLWVSPIYVAFIITAILSIMHHYPCKRAIARAKSELIAHLQHQIAEWSRNLDAV